MKTNFNEGYIEVLDGKLYYKVLGEGNPIIVLHGGPGLDHSYLLPQMDKLAQDNQVVFYDQRNSGKSSSSKFDSKSINIHQFVEDLETLRKALGYNKFTLAGHSWGGMLAMQYAISYPQRLSSLILLNSLPSTSLGCKSFFDEYAKRTSPLQDKIKIIQTSEEFTKGNPEMIDKFYRTIFSTYFYKHDQVNKLSLVFSPEEALNGFKVNDIFSKDFFSKPYSLNHDLAKLCIPTLIIHGDYDPIPVWTAEEIRDTIPNASLFVIKDCGHFPYIEQPKEFFAIIKKFLMQ